MAQKIDLKALLFSYARKIKSPLIKSKEFTNFLERYAKQSSGESSEWAKWTENTAAKIWQEIGPLEAAGSVQVRNRETEPVIFICNYWTEIVEDAYRNPDYTITVPFPDESIFKAKIPSDQMLTLGMPDLPNFLAGRNASLDESGDPSGSSGLGAKAIVKLFFPENRGEAVMPASWLPLKLLEICLAKIRNYLLKQGSKDYIRHKMLLHFSGREELLTDFINQLMTRPSECISDMQDGREISFMFWLVFCGMTKQELAKEEMLPERLTVIQAVYVVETLNGFFKSRASRAKEVELALKNLDLEFEKLPYYFTMDAIEKFKDQKGVPLLRQYGREDLEAYLKRKTTESEDDKLPDLFYLRTTKETYLVKKSRLLPLFARLLGDARPFVLDEITHRWKEMLLDWRQEPAMEHDGEFEKLIYNILREYSAVFTAIAKDPHLFLVYDEQKTSVKQNEKGKKTPARDEIPNYFSGDGLLPFGNLLSIKRHELLGEIKLTLPFWYTAPVISSIIKYFKNRNRQDISGQVKKPPQRDSPVKTENLKTKLRSVAFAEEKRLVPPGGSMDLSLENLVKRWGRVLNKQALQNLVEDVNSLVRDKLRHMMRSQRTTINPETLDSMSESILTTTAEFRKISEQGALLLYIKMYIIKLLTAGTGF